MPLNESEPLSPSTIDALARASIVIGESKKLTELRMRKVQGGGAELFFLDNIRPADADALHSALVKAPEGAVVALFSDHGLPVLFDPGADIVDKCRKLGYTIQTHAGPASWAMACAASTFLPPFFLAGFIPQKTEERALFFKNLKSQRGHVVLLETPYRFRKLLEEIKTAEGEKASLFLAWNLSLPDERLFWGTLAELLRYVIQEDLNKGEFVLILKR